MLDDLNAVHSMAPVLKRMGGELAGNYGEMNGFTGESTSTR